MSYGSNQLTSGYLPKILWLILDRPLQKANLSLLVSPVLKKRPANLPNQSEPRDGLGRSNQRMMCRQRIKYIWFRKKMTGIGFTSKILGVNRMHFPWKRLWDRVFHPWGSFTTRKEVCFPPLQQIAKRTSFHITTPLRTLSSNPQKEISTMVSGKRWKDFVWKRIYHLVI